MRNNLWLHFNFMICNRRKWLSASLVIWKLINKGSNTAFWILSNNAYRTTQWFCASVLLSSLLSSPVHSQKSIKNEFSKLPNPYPGEPPLEVQDMYSETVKLPSTGTLHVVSFLNKQSGSSVRLWTEFLPLKMLANHSVVFSNIVFPGGLFFMIPKSKALSKIRKIIENEVNQFQEGWPAEDKKVYQSLKINWVVDFKRNLFKKYELNSRYSYLFLINSEGKLLKKIRQGNPSESQSFLDLLFTEIKKTPLSEQN